VLHPPVEPGQYTSREVSDYAAHHHLVCSVGATGVCWDCESVYRLLAA
jgi:hypothetical protein